MTIPVGATLTHIYYAVRTNHYTQGDAFLNWDDAVNAAKAAYNERLTSLTDSLGGWGSPDEIVATAKSGVYMETRWIMSWHGGSVDFMHERHPDVTVLRTQASLKASAMSALRTALAQVVSETHGKDLPTLPSAGQVHDLTATEAVALARSMNEQ